MPDELSDQDLLDVIASDAPPAWVAAIAAEAFRWRDPDAQLAELIGDDLVSAIGLRSVGLTERSIGYEVNGVMIELVLRTMQTGTRVEGQILPPEALPLWVAMTTLSEMREAVVDVDANGTFAFEATGATRLRVRGLGPTGAFVTPWITLL